MFNLSNRAILLIAFIFIVILLPHNSIIEGNENGSGVDHSDVPFYQVPGMNTPGSNTTCPVEMPHNTCDLPPEVNSAADACKAINLKKQQIKQNLGIGKEILDATPMGMIDNLVDAFKGKTDVDQDLVTLVNSAKTSLSEQDNESRCDQVSSSVDENILNIDGATCMANFIKSLKDSGIDPNVAAQIAANKLSTTAHLTNITQEVKDNKKQECHINSVMAALGSQGSSLASSALQSSLQDLKGVGEIKANTSSCTGIDDKQSACSFMKSTQCCNQTTNSVKRNAMDVACASAFIDGGTQSIDSADTKSCDLSNSQNVKNDQQSDTNVSGSQTSKQHQTYNAMAYIAAIIGGIVCLIILIAAAYFYMQSKGGGGGGGMPMPPVPV